MPKILGVESRNTVWGEASAYTMGRFRSLLAELARNDAVAMSTRVTPVANFTFHTFVIHATSLRRESFASILSPTSFNFPSRHTYI
jgi:hypothetical protein